MKKGLKKTLAALAAGAMLLSMNMSAFALTYSASTTYKNATTAQVEVKYTADATEQVAFLVTKSAENNNDILYIDQKEGTGSEATFSFDMSFADAKAGATLKAGSTSEAYSESKKQTVQLFGYAITVNSDANGSAAVDETTVYDGAVKLYVRPNMGYELATIVVNEEDMTNSLTSQDDGLSYSISGINKDTTINVTFAKFENNATPVATFTKVEDYTDNDKRVVTVFGATTGETEGGILLSKNAITKETKIPENYSANADVRAFPALAKDGKGQFCVTLEEEVASAIHLTADSYYVGVYAINGNTPAIDGNAEVDFKAE